MTLASYCRKTRVTTRKGWKVWTLPNDSWSGTEIETVLDEALTQCEREEVAGTVGRVSVVEQQTVASLRQEHHLDAVDGQHGTAQPGELQVRRAVELRYDQLNLCIIPCDMTLCYCCI